MDMDYGYEHSWMPRSSPFERAAIGMLFRSLFSDKNLEEEDMADEMSHVLHHGGGLSFSLRGLVEHNSELKRQQKMALSEEDRQLIEEYGYIMRREVKEQVENTVQANRLEPAEVLTEKVAPLFALEEPEPEI